MRELRRKNRITEQLKVGEEILQINIEPTALIPKYNKAKDALALAQATAASGADADIARLGEVIIDMFGLLLGEENAAKILNFYEGDYVEMFDEVLPYLNEVIVPQLEKAASERKKEFSRKYGRR